MMNEVKKMAGGYCGRVLRINLSDGSMKNEFYDEDVLRKYIGGSGLACKIVCEETDEKTDPLGPNNVLVIMTGPLVGCGLPNTGRHQAAAKSPLTGMLGEGSSGGTWGTKLKHAGFDGVILNGVSEKPVYLHIEDGKAELRNAKELWGLDTFDTDDKLKEMHGAKTVSLSIGPAGENLVKTACLMNDGPEARTVGRTGLGAVMGSKKLKAISVIGTGRPTLADPEAAKEAMRRWGKVIHQNMEGMTKFGTPGGVEGVESIGDLPIKNWMGGSFDIKKITGQHMAATILKKSYYCASCTIGCGRHVEIPEGKFACRPQGGPEYETIGMLGSNCMLTTIEEIQKANEVCNRYGIDTISGGAALSFAMEAYETGIITKEMMDGDEIRWGNIDDMVKLLCKIAYRDGIGDLLAEGTKRAGQMLGGIAAEMSVDVKGLELPAHDPRAGDATGLQYATSTRGACHLNSLTSDLTLGGGTSGFGFMEAESYDRFEAGEKEIRLVYIHQHVMAMLDSLTTCKFLMFGLGENFMDRVLEWIKYAIGWDMTKEEFLKTGERIFNMKRQYQIKCGVTKKDDALPTRMSKRRMTGGSATNVPDVAGMIDRYYEMRRWDIYGRPTKELVSELDLAWNR
ncbi:MAG: aldehyde ferredoxin oxidoreductase family protein [Christensenellales bacterium]|jgi:aldehyde:ferredoxin oxidoreductase